MPTTMVRYVQNSSLDMARSSGAQRSITSVTILVLESSFAHSVTAPLLHMVGVDLDIFQSPVLLSRHHRPSLVTLSSSITLAAQHGTQFPPTEE